MKFEIRELDVGRGQEQLAGHALGERLYEEIIAPALGSVRAETILLLSFRGVKWVTGSVFKATWHRLHPAEGAALPSMVAHLSEDVRTEFLIYVSSQRLAGLEARDWSANEVQLATLHGQLEASSFEALRALSANPGSTAPELQSASPGNVSATAWTNRLNELHRQGLVFRQKAGRAWRFFPICSGEYHG